MTDLTEQEINEGLEKIIEGNTEIDPTRTIRLLAKLIYNLRFDLIELKRELIKTLRSEPEDIEVDIYDLPYPDKEIEKEPRRFFDDFYA